jgi:stage V sporulation protein D (sporulation-specific penicillin-binding protein)
MKPFAVRQVLDDQAQVLSETRPQAIRAVISRETARTLTDYLEGVVRQGTGTGAALESVSVAGKTGTSRKVVGGKYAPGSYTASFVGFFPAQDPKVVCLVMLDNPREGGYTGGMASAPIFRGIAQKVYATSGRFARQTDRSASAPLLVPDITMLTVEAARAILGGQGFAVTVGGTGAMAVRQHPEAGTRLQAGGEVAIVAGGGGASALAAGFSRVPDVHGLSLRRAMNRLASEQLDGDVSGSGIVSAQSPPAGTQVKSGTRVAIRCDPRPAPAAD